MDEHIRAVVWGGMGRGVEYMYARFIGSGSASGTGEEVVSGT